MTLKSRLAATQQKDQEMNILEVSSSGRRADSVSRMLSQEIIDAIQSLHEATAVTRRDLAHSIELVDD